MYIAASLSILIVMAMLLLRALLGPGLYDRILAVNSFGTATVLLIAVFGFLTERPEFLDLAILYALINYLGTIVLLKFFKFGDMAAVSDQDGEM